MTEPLLRFDPARVRPGLLTHVWMVSSGRSEALLGRVAWYAAWRRYVFYPENGTLYDRDCLRSLAEFCAKATTDHAEELVQRKEGEEGDGSSKV